MAKPQDVLVLIQLAAERRNWTIAELSARLHLPPANIQRSLARNRASGLVERASNATNPLLVEEFLVHVVKFEFPPVWTGEQAGLPTAWSAPPMSGQLHASDGVAVVWPKAGARVKGRGLEPIHPALLEIAKSNKTVYEWATVVDTIRIGGARDRREAERWLKKQIDQSLAVAA